MGALVCEAPLAAAGEACAIAGTPKLAASKIAAIEPGVTVLLFTLVPFRPKTVFGRQHTPLASSVAYGYCNWLAKLQISRENIFMLFIKNEIGGEIARDVDI